MKFRKRGKNLQLSALLLALALSACGNDAEGAGTDASTSPVSIPTASSNIPEAQGVEEGASIEETGESGSATDSGMDSEAESQQELETEPELGTQPSLETEPSLESQQQPSPTPVSSPARGALPDGFVYLDEYIPDALFEIRYASDYNFVGAVVDGYKAPVAIATEEAAQALLGANEELKQSGYALLIYDAYRPTKAVAHFIRWAADVEDTAMKDVFYPDVDKSQVFKLGYVASKSGHSRGSTIDLTVADADTGVPLDMGGPYDFFGDISSHGTKKISAEQTANRELLKNAMVRHGFKLYNKEWWHYTTLKDEPYPKKYFDFDVE